MSIPRNADKKFFNALTVALMSKINVAQTGRIVTLSDGNTHADVQLNALQSDGDKRPMLLDCPVPKRDRKHIQTGDSCVVVFVDYDTEKMTGSGDYALATKHQHDINDGFIVGVY